MHSGTDTVVLHHMGMPYEMVKELDVHFKNPDIFQRTRFTLHKELGIHFKDPNPKCILQETRRTLQGTTYMLLDHVQILLNSSALPSSAL